ncbi:unnamed protein product [Diamesa serratosioi]
MDCSKLCFFEEQCSLESSDILTKEIWNGNWEAIFKLENFQKYLTDKETSLSYDEKLGFAITALFAFLQDNFTGPNLATTSFKNVNDLLIVDGIVVDPNFRNTELLLISKNLLEDLYNEDSTNVTTCIWYLRMLKVHQQSLEENSNSIYQKVLEIHKMLTPSKLLEIPEQRYRFLIQLEIISAFMIFRRSQKVETMLNELKDLFQIETVVEGILGMRTKFQQKALPQLFLSIKQTTKELSKSPMETHKNTTLAGLLKHEDDTRLEKIKYMSEEHNTMEQLDSAIQNLILITVKFLELSQPKDKLADEELEPYLMVLINQEYGPWILRLDTLQLNIKLESNHRRTVERSLRQSEELVAGVGTDDKVTVTQKLSYIFSSSLNPRYKMECQLADLMMSLGMVKGALDIYLKLQQWEDVIVCYTTLQLRHKSAEIIQQQLDKAPTVKLWCLLGDATDDITCYEKAWKFSGEKSGRAQRHWGNYYYSKKEFEEAIPHLQRSLEINSLQEITWLRLGYATLSLEKWDLAASAYLRYTQLEPNGFESWNNLANCFIKLGDKKRAHKILHEALKCNFNNWKVWENFLLVSVDIGSFEDSLNAYNRLIELKEKYYDEEVLKILMTAIAKDLADVEGMSTNRLRKKAVELLAHLSSLHSNECVIWELSAMLTEDPLKKAQKLQKAYGANISKSTDWSKKEEEGHRILTVCRTLCEASLEASVTIKDNEKMMVLSQLSSARLTGQSCIKVATSQQWESCREINEELIKIVEQITIKMKEMKL